jgi:YVTN family beta-propeller protein
MLRGETAPCDGHLANATSAEYGSTMELPRRAFRWFCIGCVALPMAVLAGAQSTPSPSLLVLSKRDLKLAIIDPGSLKVVARVPVGEDPHEVIASTDGKTAYVSDYGGGRLHSLSVIDLAAQKPLPPIDLGPLGGPHGLTFVAGEVWFTAEGAKVIGRYDPAAQKVDWVLGTGQNRTHMIYVSPDLKRIVTTNVSSGTVSVIDKTMRRGGPGGPPPGGPRGQPPPGAGRRGPPPGGGFGGPTADWDETVVKVGNGSEGFDISPDGKEVWVANSQDGTISIIDLATKAVTQTLAVDVQGANRLKFTLDGKLALVSTLGGPDLTIVDTASRKVIKRLPIGSGAAGILIEPGGARAFVACSPDDYVAVIDLKTLTVAGKIDAGGEPDGLAWAAAS